MNTPFLRLIVFMTLSASAFGTTAVTGHITRLDTTTPGVTAYVRFWLRGTRGNQPRITGTGAIAPQFSGSTFYVDLPADASGNISGTIYSTRDSTGTGAGDIEAGGSYTAVYYGMQIVNGGIPGPEIPVHARSGGTLDIANISAVSTLPIVTAPTGDTTYARLDGGNSPFTGAVSFASTVTTNNLNKALMVGGGAGDIGAQINAAYASLPANGGVVVVIPKSDNSCYSFTTPIVANVSGKYLLLEGQLAGGTGSGCLNYIPSTGSAITLDYVPVGGSRGAVYGIKDLFISNNLCTSIGGCGGSTTGITVSSTNGGIDGAIMQNVTIQGFTVGYGENARVPSSEVQWSNPRIYNNGVGMNLFATAEEQIIGGTFYGNGNHIQSGDTNSQPELHITGTYFIAHSNEAFAFTNTSLGGTIYLTDVHLENGANSTINAHFVEGNVSIFGKGGVAEDDSSGGTADWWFNPSGLTFIWDGLELVTASRNPTIGVLDLAGNTRAKLAGFIINPATLTSIVGGANAAKATVCMLSGDITHTASACKIESPLQDGTGISYTKATASGTATVDLASVASAACTADSSDVTLTGAAVGDPVRVSAATALPAGVWLIGRVTASNTGRFQLCNLSGGAVDRASDTYTISVVK